MKRNETAGVLGQIRGSLIAEADDRDLKLHLDQLGIEPAHQFVINENTADVFEFEIVIVIAELKTSALRLLADLVQAVGGALPVIHAGVSRDIEARQNHLCQAELL